MTDSAAPLYYFASLFRHRRTGLVEVEALGTITGVYLQAGHPVVVEDGAVGETIGRLLMHHGVIDQTQHGAIIDALAERAAKQPDVRYGDVALERGVVSKEALDRALGQQVQLKLLRCLQLPTAVCRFFPDQELVAEKVHFPCRLEPLVLATLGRAFDPPRVDQLLARVAGRFPELRVSAEAAATRFGLRSTEVSFLGSLQGTQSYEQIRERANLDALRAGHILSALLLLGYVESHWTAKASQDTAASVPVPPSSPVSAAIPPSSRSPASRSPSSSRMPAARSPSSSRMPAAPAPSRPRTLPRPDEFTQQPDASARFSRPATGPQTIPPGPSPRGSAPPPSRAPSGFVVPPTGYTLPPESARQPESQREGPASGSGSFAIPKASRGAPELPATPPPSQVGAADPGSSPRSVTARLRSPTPPTGGGRRGSPQTLPSVDTSPADGQRPSHRPPPMVKRAQLSAEQLFLRGKRCVDDNQPAAGLKDLEQAAALHPEAVEYRLYATWARYRTEKDPTQRKVQEEVLNELSISALQQDRNLAFGHYVQGHLKLAAGDKRTAERAFKTATKLDPNNLDAERHRRILHRARTGTTQR